MGFQADYDPCFLILGSEIELIHFGAMGTQNPHLIAATNAFLFLRGFMGWTDSLQ